MRVSCEVLLCHVVALRMQKSAHLFLIRSSPGLSTAVYSGGASPHLCFCHRQEAGLPDGVVNVIHGEHEAVNFICDNPDIKAISFVGSDQAVRRRVLTMGSYACSL